jgi:hypothetical protein
MVTETKYQMQSLLYYHLISKLFLIFHIHFFAPEDISCEKNDHNFQVVKLY